MHEILRSIPFYKIPNVRKFMVQSTSAGQSDLFCAFSDLPGAFSCVCIFLNFLSPLTLANYPYIVQQWQVLLLDDWCIFPYCISMIYWFFFCVKFLWVKDGKVKCWSGECRLTSMVCSNIAKFYCHFLRVQPWHSVQSTTSVILMKYWTNVTIWKYSKCLQWLYWKVQPHL